MVRMLEDLGAIVSVLPTVDIREPSDWGPVDRALANFARYHWLVFTSVNGVHAFVKRLRHNRFDLRAFGAVKLAVIGPATADALRIYHLEPDLIPEEYRSESLAAALKERARGQRILLARADRGRDLLREALAVIAEVEQVAVYSQVDTVEPDPVILDALRRGEMDFITLTSSNIARALVRVLDAPTRRLIEEGKVRLVSISPVTSATVRELGLPVAAEASEYTSTGLVTALCQAAHASS
jgi:uroporphyrinogen III methyltransferase/synthase